MKILLISPLQQSSYPQPPLGLSMLAAVLEKNGHSVKIVDLNVMRLSEVDVVTLVNNERPEIVGITAMTSMINVALELSQVVKKVNCNIKIVLGGAHVSLLPEETLGLNNQIDFIVRGEGELTIVELVDVIQNNGDFSKILGLTYRTPSGIKSNDRRTPILNLDELPFPAFHLLEIEKYLLHPPFGRKSPAMPIMVSRGCPYNCIFCSKSVFGAKYRNNSSAYVVNQINFLLEKFGVKEIKFYDDVFTLQKKWVLEICAELKKQHIDIPWTCETRVNLVDEELLTAMKAAGCYMIAYGVESGDQQILNQVGKNITLDNITKAFDLTHKAEINTVGYFMLGAPNETAETIQRTIKFAQKLNPDFVQFSIATPYPGTELYKIAVEHGCLPESWNGYVYADLNNFNTQICEFSSLSSEELHKWSRKAYKSFYLRRAYIAKRFRKMTSIDELKTNAVGLRMLFDLIK